MSKYDYEYVWDNYYCYPGTNVLINRLGIQDSDLLSEAERRVTALNILEIKDNPVRGKFDLKHLCDIHKAIFGDVFAWAGKLRTVNIAKGNQFCLFQHLETYAASVFSELKAEKYLDKWILYLYTEQSSKKTRLFVLVQIKIRKEYLIWRF